VLEAAINAAAEFIVTSNIKDFPATLMTDVTVKAVTLDEFLTHIERINPNDVRKGLQNHLVSLKSYEITARAYSAMLIKNKLVTFHASVSDILQN
jgi:hypothetical protein